MGNGHLYCFGRFELDSWNRTLSLAGSTISLTPKTFDLLTYLARNPNRLVTKEELLQAVWGRTFVEEGNLTQYISHLRKALEDTADNARLIVTIARKGYQFTPEVTVRIAPDGATREAVQTSAPQDSGADAQSGLQRSQDRAVSAVPRRWWSTAILTACVLVAAALSYSTWRQLRPTAPTGSGRITLAVLPFQNLTGDSDKEYLADGLTEEMISQLSRLSPVQLAVISRTSVMRYKNKDE